MNLLQKVHTLWAADSTLVGLLPASRLTTGRAASTSGKLAYPYGSVSGPLDTNPHSETNDGWHDDCSLRFQLWASSYASARALFSRLPTYFRGLGQIALDDSQTLQFRLGNADIIEETDDPAQKVWQVNVTLLVTFRTPKPA